MELAGTEAKLLAGVVQTDTHKRLQVAEELLVYFKNDDNSADDFPEFERLIASLAAWMTSSNFKVSIHAMEILGVLVVKMKESFKPHLPTVFPSLRERLGDAKGQVQEQAQLLIQLIMQNVVATPQTILDRLLDSCFTHKNWRVKEQGLMCLSRTLSYFGSGQVSVSKFISSICTLLGDANSQVRSCAMETIVEIYRHVGVKVRIDLSRRGLSASRMSQLTARFDAVDATTGNSSTMHSDTEEVDDDRESISSCGSNLSARTHGSTRSVGSSRSASRAPSRPSSVARMAAGASAGAVTESSFEKVFADIPDINLFTQHDVDKKVTDIVSTLSNTSKEWDTRIAALKELRSVVKNEAAEHAYFLTLLRNLESPMVLSLKDLRSQVTREACITLSYMAVMLGVDIAHLAEQMIPPLISLLQNSAKVMASSAEICLKFIFKNIHTHRILTPLSTNGLTSRSPVARKQCAELFCLAVTVWPTHRLDKAVPLVEEILRKGLSDADSTARRHIRRAFWSYYRHFPSNARRMLDSFDPQLQKHINDEKTAMERDGNAAAASNTGSLRPPHPRRKPAPLSSASATNLMPEGPKSPSSPEHAPGPSIRLIRPTLRSPRSPRVRHRTDPKSSLRSASSMDNMLDRAVSPTSPKAISPIPRPPSRTEKITGVRPPSRTGIPKVQKRNSGRDLISQKPKPGMYRSRSAQPSPSHSREGSPTGLRTLDGVSGMSTLPRKLAPLTRETMLKLHGNGGGGAQDEDDDAGSVTSECSTFSISSEVSVSPYVKYPHPVTDLNELVALCSSQQWSDRRDGIAQMHMLLESSRPFSHSDMQKVKAVFKRMFAEPHAKVYGMFLESLARFIDEHREYLDDLLFVMLLRLLHRHGTDMLSSVHFKLQVVLEMVRKSFDADMQFSVLCRILTDQTQPMNNKVKLGWLEYMQDLLPMLDSADFKDVTEVRQSVSKLLGFTTEPKSAEIRKQSQKVVVGLFELNPATFTLMLRNVPKPLQESANKILKTHMAEMSSSSGEESDKESSPKRTRRKSGDMSRTPVRRTPTHLREDRPKTPSRLPTPSSSLTPSAARGLRGARTISSSTPDKLNYGHDHGSLSRSTSKSRIPTPRTGLHRPMSTTPGQTPSSSYRRAGGGGGRSGIPPRAQSVDPYKMSQKSMMNSRSAKKSLKSTERIRRPGSSKSEYTPTSYQNGGSDGDSTLNNSLEHFSFSDLPNLDFGSPDEDEGEEDFLHKDQMAVVTRELQSAASSKLRHAALQSLYTLARESPEKCKWDEHFKTVLIRLMDLISDNDSNVRGYSLRVLREMLKTDRERVKDYVELTTMKVLKAFADTDSVVSQAAEDVFSLLAPALPPENAIGLLSPMVANEKYPMLLGTIKLLTKVVILLEVGFLKSKLGDVVPGVIRGYCHSESSVRKASVFCLVSIHSVVGEDIRQHLTKLSSSQTKLLDLYIKRHQQETAKKGSGK